MSSMVFNSLFSRRNKTKGGRGMKGVKTVVVRVPVDHLIELDILLQDYKARSVANPTSPRYHFLNKFIEELEGIFPGIDD